MRGVVRSIGTLVLLLSGACLGDASAQAPGQGPARNAAILEYIRSGWDRLSRSTTECSSLVDPKVTTPPVLYLPFGMTAPETVVALQTKCHVRLEHLPRTVVHLGDVRPAELPAEGLLYLPNRYVVPGGRFNEMYGWDSYFILLGLLNQNRDDLARGMVENFFFEIENYGALLNANRTYFLTRSQPPLLSSMIRDVYEHPGTTPLSKEWLAHAYALAERDHALWTSDIHRIGNTGLARYRDIGAGPVPEMADDSSYYPDVIRWLLAHPEAGSNYLLTAPAEPKGAQVEELARTSCDIRISHVCERAVVDGHRLTASFFASDRGMRESGFDTSFRFGPFSGSTEDYAPICLNSLLFKYEVDLAHFATLLGRKQDAARWTAAAEARRAAVNRTMWNAQAGYFYDWNSRTGKQSTYNDLAGFYPLWTGLATAAQASAMEQRLKTFEHAGGLAMSNTDSGTQWDLPYGWAPTNWLTVAGLERYGFHEDAMRLAKEFSGTVLENFERDGTVREKYNVVSGSANVAVAAGYKTNVIGFGWTNGVYLRMHDLLQGTGISATSVAQR
ncbi:MAG: trehalase family glycosidase [Janthinobacterium lividum]